ncbi:MAG: transcriptional repressor [Gammaproteobacteria bacterium]|nr:transcriptional repressor [Gammaproteobacteria bacterium]
MKLTKNQQAVFQALTKSSVPLTAYELLDQLRKQGFRAPPQIYRALEKLTEYGLVHRVESLNAFVACNHDDDSDHGISALAICDNCSVVLEFPANKVAKQLVNLASDQGFGLRATTIELSGLCEHCQAV